MGKRKRLAAEARKEAMKTVAIASLNETPTSTRKMRIVADTIRGKSVEQALNLLTFSKREASRRLEKLLRSAIKNWEAKNEGQRVEESDLFVKTVFVDPGVTLKRFLPAPQGRAYRLRKRSNHVTLIVDSRLAKPVVEEVVEETTVTEAAPAPAATETKTAKPKAKKAAKPKAEKKPAKEKKTETKTAKTKSTKKK